MAKVIIVNENDEIIGYKERDALEPSDIYRVSTLWIESSNGDILLTQRSFAKKKDPGKWQPAVAGTNEEGETYESNIIKETEEEIGIKNETLEKKFKIRKNSDNSNFFCQVFFLGIDKPISEFKIQEEEVEQIKWFVRSELIAEMKQNPDKFVGAVGEWIDLFNK